MTLWAKSAGAFASAKTLYVKQGGVWVPAKQGYVQNAATWKSFLAQPAIVAFQQLTAHTNEGQSVTFTAVPLGPVYANRTIFMMIPWYNGSTTTSAIGSVTMDGVAMKLHAQATAPMSSQGNGMALVSLKESTKTTANIVVNFATSGKGFYRPRLAVYNVQNIQSDDPLQTPLVYSQTSNSSDIPHTFTHPVKKDGIALLGCVVFGNVNTRNLAGLPKDYNLSPVSSWVYVGGGAATAADNSAFSATVSNGTTALWNAIMASFR